MRTSVAAMFLAASAALAACSDTTGPGSGGDQVAVRFTANASGDAQVNARQQGSSLLLTGSNGTLRIDEVFVIVDRFELKRVDDDACVEEDHSCERFSAPPMLLELPLDSSSVVAVRQPVEPGTYRKLKFEVEDLDDTDDDDVPGRAQQIQQLRAAIRARFPDWPEDAGMLVVGSFTPTGGTAVPFRAYFEAEIEIERTLVPPVTVGESDATFTVHLDLGLLFRQGNGLVMDLSAFDFARTGRVPEFEFQVEHGFSKIEFDD